MGHPVNLLVMAPGNYTFSDFLRIGWRIFLVSFVMLMLGLLLFWSFSSRATHPDAPEGA